MCFVWLACLPRPCLAGSRQVDHRRPDLEEEWRQEHATMAAQARAKQQTAIPSDAPAPSSEADSATPATTAVDGETAVDNSPKAAVQTSLPAQVPLSEQRVFIRL